MGGSSTTVEAPKPSTEEIALQKEQLAILKQSRAEQEFIKPYVLQSMGLVQETTPEGVTAYRRMTDVERTAAMTPIERLSETAIKGQLENLKTQQEIQKNELQTQLENKGVTKKILDMQLANLEIEQAAQKSALESQLRIQPAQEEIFALQQKRQLAALKGELPVSPALEAEIGQQKTALNEDLSRRLGSNWQTTTPGQQAMSEFERRSGLLREEARRGEITSGAGILASQTAGLLSSAQAASKYQSSQPNFLNFPTGTTSQDYYNYSNRLSPLMQGYGQAQQPYQYYGGLQYQANAANAANSQASSAGLLGGLGSLVGSGVMAYGTYAGLAA